MKNKRLISGAIAFLLLIILSIFILNNYQVQVQERQNKPIELPPQTSGKCGLEGCHGLDVTCGSNIPEVCDLMYMAGDSCRQFADCQVIDGSCQLEESSLFDSCKSCVEKCERDYSDDQVKFFQCEGSCAE